MQRRLRTHANEKEEEMMEIKTKYNIGDDVYYISYATVERECECCGQTIDDEVPDSVKKGKIIGISVNIDIGQDLDNIISEMHTYKINTENNWFVLRNSNFVYDTEEEAQTAFEKENEQLKFENAALRERLSHSLELPYMEQTVSRNGTEDTILYYLENGKLQQECFNNKFPEQLQARLAELKGEKK